MWAFEVIKDLSLLSLPFTLYFGYTKIGYDVRANFTWRSTPFTASGIADVTLVNLKDRTVVIFGAYALTGEMVVTLMDFDPPLILKALEATTIKVKPVSARYLGTKAFDWKLPRKRSDIKIFLSVPGRKIKCEGLDHPDVYSIAKGWNVPIVNQATQAFNGVVYNHNALYALTYVEKGDAKTALIDKGGFIHWDFALNSIPAAPLKSPEETKMFLASTSVAAYISQIRVDHLDQDLRGTT